MIRVIVIDREGFYIDAIMTVLDNQPDIDAIAGVEFYEDFVEPAQSADIAVIQYESDPALTRQLILTVREDVPDAEVVLIGVPDDQDLIVSYLEAGALGYVRDTEETEDVLSSIRVIANGQALIDPELVAPVLRRLADLNAMVRELVPNSPSDIKLTNRQKDVIELVVRGHTNQEIADELELSIGTVKNHMNNILAEFGVPSRQQAAAIYLQMRDEDAPDGK